MYGIHPSYIIILIVFDKYFRSAYIQFSYGNILTKIIFIYNRGIIPHLKDNSHKQGKCEHVQQFFEQQVSKFWKIFPLEAAAEEHIMLGAYVQILKTVLEGFIGK